MSLKMYWVLERRDTVSDWHAVVSCVSLFRPGAPARGDGLDAARAITTVDRAFFDVMSGIGCSSRGRVDPALEPFSRPGLPHDASHYARNLLEHPLATGGALRKARLKNPGHIRASDLKRAAKRSMAGVGSNASLSENAPAEDYLARLFRRIEIIIGEKSSTGAPHPDQPNLADREILFGTVTERFLGSFRHDQMDTMSTHDELIMFPKLKSLAPCTPQNLRMLFAYGV